MKNLFDDFDTIIQFDELPNLLEMEEEIKEEE